MSDSVTATSSQSWFSRLGGAIAGVVVGVILFILAFPLLTWNEGRAIKRAKTLQAGAKAVVSVSASPVAPANEGKLVYVTGKLAAAAAVTDEAFGVTAPVIRLRRAVEMYQWVEDQKSETQKKLGGGEETVTTYTYSKKWTDSPIDSSDFHEGAGHANPGAFPVASTTTDADPVTVGDFTLPASLVDRLDDFTAFPVGAGEPAAKPADLDAPVRPSQGGYYIGNDPKQPAVGDLKVRFEVVKAGPVSIVARQVASTFEPYPVEGTGEIELLQAGTVSADGMFKAAEQENVVMTWLLRLAGFVVMFIGLALIGNPLSVLADVIPFIGDLVGAGVGLFAFVIALALSLGTIAVAWLAFRPLIGVPLLVAAVAAIVFGVRAMRRRQVAPAAAPSA